jgi:hypothetical protein
MKSPVYRYVAVQRHQLHIMHLQLQAAVDVYQASLYPVPRPPRGPASLASLLCHLFHNLTNLQRLTHITPSEEPAADEDADSDVKYWLTPPG